MLHCYTSILFKFYVLYARWKGPRSKIFLSIVDLIKFPMSIAAKVSSKIKRPEVNDHFYFVLFPCVSLQLFGNVK